MKVLILGGTGAMGVSLSQILTEKGNEAFVTTRSDKDSKGNIHYLKGNAHDESFVFEILKGEYDAIVDFMHYDILEFTKERATFLLNATKHYIFLSSSRVYGYSEKPITEGTPRLLDCCGDEEYLKTSEYALTKAREENILRSLPQKNWTIIRPYITYNVERLQLGVLEKEQWLFRALHGRSIVFFKDIAEHFTTLTYGYDLAFVLSLILCKKECYGETYHITSPESVKWADILNIYKEVLKTKLGNEPKVKWIDKAESISELNKYQINYCRLFDRRFDNSKILKATKTDYCFTPLKEGLTKCVEQFINEKRNFKNISWLMEAKFDKLSGEVTPLREINGIKNKIAYVVYRFTPFARIWHLLSRLKHAVLGKKQFN